MARITVTISYPGGVFPKTAEEHCQNMLPAIRKKYKYLSRKEMCTEWNLLMQLEVAYESLLKRRVWYNTRARVV